MLKVDLHVHTNLDPIDGQTGRGVVKHSCEELFAEAQRLGFDAIALTHHVKRIYSDEIAQCAKKYGVLAIQGAEVVIGKAHVLLVNTPHDEVYTFDDLAKLREEHPEVLVIAPHPYYPGAINLRSEFNQYQHLFDAVEYSHFYFRGFNPFNRKALSQATKYNKPVVGTGDVHYLDNLGYTYSIVNTTKKDAVSICDAIKAGSCETVSQPLPVRNVIKSTASMLFRLPKIIFGVKSYSLRTKPIRAKSL